MNAYALQIRDDGNAIIRDLARTIPAKIFAANANISPRHVYNLREEIGQPDLAWPSFIMVAKQYPELRVKVMEWLDASIGDNDRDPSQVLNEIQRLLMERAK
jgi:hypothetical protein